MFSHWWLQIVVVGSVAVVAGLLGLFSARVCALGSDNGEDPCPPGCFEIKEPAGYCESNTEFYRYEPTFVMGRVAKDNFNDPSADPDKVADIRRTVTRIEYDAEACECVYMNCSYPCVGAHVGNEEDRTQVPRETQCVEPSV